MRRIIRSWQQIIVNHSSTNDLFFAAKSLSKETRAYISTLSSQMDVSGRKAELQYHSDSDDLEDTRREKFLARYDTVMQLQTGNWLAEDQGCNVLTESRI